MNSHRRRRVLAQLALLGALPGGVPVLMAPTFAADPPLTLGLVPYLSPAAMLSAYRPLREHLERTLGRAVEMVTTKDFRTLVEATRSLRYDVVLLPAHVARLAISDWRHEPLATTAITVHVQVLVRANSAIKRAADLGGGRAGMLDALSLTGTVGRKWLQDQGLGDSVEVVSLPSINTALHALDHGEISMVVAATSQLLALPPATPRSERVLAEIRDIPPPIYIARPGYSAAELARLRAALASFKPDPSQPTTAHNTLLQPVSAQQLATLDSFAAIARKALAAPR